MGANNSDYERMPGMDTKTNVSISTAVLEDTPKTKIIVRVPERQASVFDADNWSIDSDGQLWIFRGSIAIATFAGGVWESVMFLLDEEKGV